MYRTVQGESHNIFECPKFERTCNKKYIMDKINDNAVTDWLLLLDINNKTAKIIRPEKKKNIVLHIIRVTL